MYAIKKICAVFALLGAFTFHASAQCKSLVKKNLPKLIPFVHNGQLNTASLPEGGVADFKITCYTGMTYRLAVASDTILGKVTFKVLDEDNQELYSGGDKSASIYDFNVDASQDLTVEISVPLTEKSIRGCIALLVGFKEPKHIGIR